MAFNQRPIVDGALVNSDLSIQKLKAVLSFGAGFVCREDKPDLGCDFDIELILDGKATDWRFPCQLKSVQSPTLISDGQFISYSFLTSRLGYLMARRPSMGIIVLYAVDADMLYYDYADKIYERLLSERDSDDWKQNDYVNIHFPVSQVFNEEEAAKILVTMQRRFESGKLMQESFGKQYGLPVEGVDGEEKYDFNNPSDISKYLSKYGLMLLNNYDLGDIHAMILKVPNREIFQDIELLKIAAISYCEAGAYVDADFYYQKLRSRKPELDAGTEEMMKFIELKILLALGNIDDKSFTDGLRSMLSNAHDSTSKIVIGLNIVRYDLIELKSLKSITPTIEPDIENIFKAIRTLDTSPRKRGLLMLWNAENLSQLSLAIFTQQGAVFQMKETMGSPAPLHERLAALNRWLPYERKFSDTLQEVYKIVKETGDLLLKSYTVVTHVKHFISSQVRFLGMNANVDDMGDMKERLKAEVNNALTACNYFVSQGFVRDAYHALNDAIEISTLANGVYQVEAYENPDLLLQKKWELEQQHDIAPIDLIIPGLIERLNRINTDDRYGQSGMAKLDDEQIEKVARIALEALKLPEDRLINIINECKGYRMFHLRCSDENIVAYQVKDANGLSGDNYRYPVKFVLESKKTRIASTPNADMNELLISWGF
ncbi:MAG: DUF4365 domain-containing protein [Chitinophagaceae bacterium]|nr:DUF4365 domain-containing protein [Chitinophagaceae bacterium]MCA6460379.1 DUF4365 domain-containing protein [Chitinophagaceae bacterium]MCA6465266.1 DUF4365 domain-containing protein [Chitinophagaceae bacterium]